MNIDILIVIAFWGLLFYAVIWAATRGTRARAVRSFSCPNDKFVGDDYEYEVPTRGERLPTQAEYKAMAMAEVKLKIDMEKLLGK